MAPSAFHHQHHPPPTRRADPRPGRPPRRGQPGQVLPLVLVVLALATALALGAVRLGAAVARREAAQAAADASALAGAAHGEQAARAVAVANRARVVAFRAEGLDVVVTVERAGVTRSARARWVPDPHPTPPGRRASPPPGGAWSGVGHRYLPRPLAERHRP